MKQNLNVLVLENRAGAAGEDVPALLEAGHRVHRCHDAGDEDFVCRGMRDEGCPLDGDIDVALLVRRGVTPRPSHLEDGVRCAIRAGIPIVEQGPDTLDPFEPWITRRVPLGGSVVTECSVAADRSFDPVRDAILSRIGAVLMASGVDMSSVGCEIESRDQIAHVHITLPSACTSSVEQALGVRVLDALRSSGRTFGQVHVHVHGLREAVPG
jgi:hypothetical protein